MSPTRIALWSGPRNVSTALMYSFAQRSDTWVQDEPLFGYFLKHTGVERPSRQEVLATMETDPFAVIDELLLGPVDQPVLFVKHMANHLEGLDFGFIKAFRNVILTRHPAAVIASYTRLVEQPTLLDLAYGHQVQIVDYLKKAGLPYAILDSADVCNHTEKVLRALCSWCEIPFEPSMLIWEPGPRPEDGVWAKYWYQNVHQSRGFEPYSQAIPEIPATQEPLLDMCLPLYQRLVKQNLINSENNE